MSYVEKEAKDRRAEVLLSGIYVGHLDHALPLRRPRPGVINKRDPPPGPREANDDNHGLWREGEADNGDDGGGGR